MTFEEKLDRLVERHEALAQSVESLAATTHEHGEQIRVLTANIEKLVEVSNRDAGSINILARIVENHERRLSGMEGG